MSRIHTILHVQAHVHARCVLLALALGGGSIGCGEPSDDDSGNEPLTLEQRIEALADCTPTDLTILVPWTGPAFDPATGALVEPLPTGHVEAVANGWADRNEEATALRIEQATLVVEDLFTHEGLLGFQGVESVECDIGFSHSLWRDEDAMYAFVTSPAHAKAMSLATRMHHDFAGAHWLGEARTEPPTWQQGLDRYVEELRDRGD